MDLATLDYLKDTEQLVRVIKHTSEDAPDLGSLSQQGVDGGYAWPTASVRELLMARGGSITRAEYEAFKRGVIAGQTKYWAGTQAK